MKKFVPVLVALAAVSLGGCGGSDDAEDPGESALDSTTDAPKCSEIWKVGETLDITPYDGCEDGDTYIVGTTSGCYDAESNYIGQVATYKDLWVVQKGTDPKMGTGGTPGKVTDVDPEC